MYICIRVWLNFFLVSRRLLEIADPEATPTGATETTGEETVATPPRPPPKTPASGNNETDGREEELIRL